MSVYNKMNREQLKTAVYTYGILLKGEGIITTPAYNKIIALSQKKGARLKKLLEQLENINDTWTPKNEPTEASKSQYRHAIYHKKIRKLGFKAIMKYKNCLHFETYTYGLGTYYVYRSFNNQMVSQSFMCIAQNLTTKLEYPCALHVALDLRNHYAMYSSPDKQHGQFSLQTIEALGGSQNIVNTNQVNIYNAQQVFVLFQNLAQMRLKLKEIYAQQAEEGQDSLYEQILSVRVGVDYYAFDDDDEVGDKTKFLFDEILHPNQGTKGECVLRILHQKGITDDSFENILLNLNKTRPQFILSEWESLEAYYDVDVVLFDSKLNLMRVGELNKSKRLYVLLFNKHAYSFREDLIPASILHKQINFMDILCQGTQIKKTDLLKSSLDFLPDRRAALHFACNTTGKCCYIYNARTHAKSVWGNDSNNEIYVKQTVKNLYLPITSDQFEGLDNKTIDGIKPNIEMLTKSELSKSEKFSMNNMIAFDLETMSYEDNKFHTYAAGWYYKNLQGEELTSKYKAAVVDDETDLRDIVYKMVEDWIGMIKNKKGISITQPYSIKNIIEYTYQKAFKTNYKLGSHIINYFNIRTKVAFIATARLTIQLRDYLTAREIKIVKLPLKNENITNSEALRALVVKHLGNTFEKTYYRAGRANRAIQAFRLTPQSEYLDMPQHYAYSYNGSRFDNLEVIYHILDNQEKREFEITDLIKSSGRIISFNYGPIKFLDLCLLMMSSLKAACSSFAIKTKKGYMPHRYLQHLTSWNEFHSRLNSKNKLGELETYIDWLDDMAIEAEEYLQKRYLNPDGTEKPIGDMIDKYSNTKKWFNENKDETYDFKQQMSDYLYDDVKAVWELLGKFGKNTYKDFTINITSTPTIGSLTTKIWKSLMPQNVPKLLNTTSYTTWKKGNRGGYSGPLESLYFNNSTTPDRKGWKVDITSLYPSSCDNNALYDKWYNEFPYPKNGWIKEDYKGAVLANQLDGKHGIFFIRFNQTHLNKPNKYAPVLCNVEGGKAKSLTRIEKGSGWFSTNLIRYYKDMGVAMNLYQGEYTFDTFNPFRTFMNYFKNLKNEADKIKKQELAKPHSQRDQNIIQKCIFDRTFAKLMLNSLIGRLNMNAERQQTLLTESYNDCISLMGNPFIDCNTAEVIEIGDKFYYSMTYKEDDLVYQLGKLDIAPYLSCCVLDYSKILMAENFRYIKEIGGKLLYTDTDSILWDGTVEMFNKYSKMFCLKNEYVEDYAVNKKTFGYMEIEGVYNYYCSVGPKKYIVEANDYYEYRANGIGAKQNINVPIKERFERLIFDKKAIQVNHFSIKCQKGISKLIHSYKDTKKINPLFFKGRLENKTEVKLWKNEAEFASNAIDFFSTKETFDTIELTTLEYT